MTFHSDHEYFNEWHPTGCHTKRESNYGERNDIKDISADAA